MKPRQLQLFILFLFGLLLYANTITFDYTLDDKIVITHNQFTKQGVAGLKDILTTDVFVGFFGVKKTLVAGGRYRPLSLVTYAIEWQLFGQNPYISHFINVLLYAFTALLIFIVLNQLIPPLPKQKWFLSLPFVATLLYIAHPLHTEVIANIKGRDEIMTFLGGLAALYFTLQYLDNKKIIYLFYSPLCFFLALMAKENIITFLLIVPISVFFFTKHTLKQNWVAVSPLLIITFLYLWLRYHFVGAPGSEDITELMNNPFLKAGTTEKFATIIYTMGLYIKLLFFPHPLTHDYYPWHPIALGNYSWEMPVPYPSWGDWKVIVPLLLHAGMLLYVIVVCYKMYKKKNQLSAINHQLITAYGILFYLVTFSIVSNLIFPVGAFMNERFMYISSLGFCLIMGYFLIHFLDKFKDNAQRQIISTTFLLLILFGYSFKTISRNTAWKNDYSLSMADVKTSVNSAKVNMSAGNSLLEKANAETDKNKKTLIVQQAITYLSHSLKIYPTYIQPMLLMGNGYYMLENYEHSLVYYENCLKINPAFNDAINNLLHVGEFCEKNKQYDLAVKSFNILIQYRPDEYMAFSKLGELYGKDLGRLNEALDYLNRANELRPNDSDILQKMGVTYAMLGNPQKALELFQQALALKPDNAPILMNIGITYSTLGETEKAKEYMDRAIAVDSTMGK